MIYCYARVSTKEQKLDRQISAFEPYKPYILYQDKESGKDFERKQYQKMRKKIKPGDTLIVLSLDRFGRNYDQIKKEFAYYSNLGVCIKVLDMPIIDTTSNNLINKFISDLVIQLLGFVAETERENIKKRQAQGIALAKANGVHMGRPKAKLPTNFEEICRRFDNKEMSLQDALRITGLTKATFFKYKRSQK